jgi:hypothetical protein
MRRIDLYENFARNITVYLLLHLYRYIMDTFLKKTQVLKIEKKIAKLSSLDKTAIVFQNQY